MVTRDDDLILTYNGEVYNFNELKSQLEARGHRFRSTSDTEVVLEAISEWGVSALSRFNGMFALAAHCKKTNSVTLARDRYGIKPLYYAQSGKVLLFASEVKAFLAHPDFLLKSTPKV